MTPLVTDKRSEGTGMLRKMLSSVTTALRLCSCIKPGKESYYMSRRENCLNSWTSEAPKKRVSLSFTHTLGFAAG